MRECCCLFSAQELRHQLGWTPLIQLTQWWHFLVLGLLAIFLIAMIGWVAFKDRHRHSFGIVIACLVFRLSVLTILAIVLGGLQRQKEKVEESPSQIAVLLDNSTSMNFPSSQVGSETRFKAAQSIVSARNLWEKLSGRHEIRFFHFSKPHLVEFSRIHLQEKGDSPSPLLETSGWSFPLVFLGSSFFVFSLAWICRKQNARYGQCVAVGSILMVMTAYSFGLIYVADAQPFPTENLKTKHKVSRKGLGTAAPIGFVEHFSELLKATEGLQADMSESPISTSLAALMKDERSQNLAGIYILSDGADTTINPSEQVISVARERGIVLVSVGLGAARAPNNLALSQIKGPRKVYQGDPFTISGNLSMHSGFGPFRARVNLFSRKPKHADDHQGTLLKIATQTIEMRTGERQEFQFHLNDKGIGKTEYTTKVEPFETELNTIDNQQSVTVDIVDRKSRILLMAGGPNREFRFLRNHLFRQSSMETHVFLQSADPGASQESDQLLDGFPVDPKGLDQYDCIVAFDPDWTRLSLNQAEMMKSWVAQDGGGMVVVAGPVNTPVWTSRPGNDPVARAIRKLYPVSFYTQGTGSIRLGRFGGAQSFPLSFTRASSNFDFLEISNDPMTNQKFWENVKVFGYYAVNEEKAGADIIANFSDPITQFSGKYPIYLASHLYGSGRVFFQASGELWRTREIGTEFFENYYTRLILWSSQGRLNRGDDPVLISIDRETCPVGEYVNIRLVEKPQSGLNVGADALELNMTVLGTNGKRQGSVVELKEIEQDAAGAIFGARIKVSQPGNHILRLAAVGITDARVVECRFQGIMPNEELRNPSQNKETLSRWSENTQGTYLGFRDLAHDLSALEKTVEEFPDHSLKTRSPLGDDLNFKRKLNFYLFGCLFLFLSASWIIRRLNQLA